MELVKNADSQAQAGQRGFTLTELMIAMMVFTLIMGSVVLLVTKSQTIFKTEQGVAEMDQNARLLMDFLTRDIQESKENAIGVAPNFRPVFSYNAPDGSADELTIVSSDTQTRLPGAALPLFAASSRPFSAFEQYAEVIPNAAGRLTPGDVVGGFKEGEEFLISTVLQDGSTQFDIVKVRGASVTQTGTIGLSFDPVQHKGVESEVAFGSVYENGSFSMRPVTVKRYFVDKTEDKQHPSLALSVDGSEPIIIAKNIMAFQLRYLEAKEGELDGTWVKAQTINHAYKTLAVEVTLSARTQIKDDPQSERLITLASVVRPRFQPRLGNIPVSGARIPGGSDGGPGRGVGTPSGDGSGDGFDGGSGSDGSGGSGAGSGAAGDGYNRVTKRIGKAPKLGQRLNQ
ncbi:MAG: hypothetical protein DMF61_16555 [Blastocatellia bacterium AA13]|nr:MAG: hypothetical protein DMF61_16555 [Blastocatellia bacterium AA13]